MMPAIAIYLLLLFSNTVKPINDTTFNVFGQLDAQNGFGAMIRSSFSVTVVFSSDGEFMFCQDLVIQ